MKMILHRNDDTSIFCRTESRHRTSFSGNTKVIKVTIACALLLAGVLIVIMTR